MSESPTAPAVLPGTEPHGYFSTDLLPQEPSYNSSGAASPHSHSRLLPESTEKKRRRVQWAHGTGTGVRKDRRDAEMKVRKEEQEEDENEEMLGRALDEHGLDSSAFAALRAALQSHQSLSPPLSPSRSFPVYVAPDQTFGIPAPEPPSADDKERGHVRGGRSWVRKAGELVGVHRGGAWRRRFKQRREGEKGKEGMKKPTAEAPLPLQGRGVLSSLLTLYDPAAGASSAPSSRSTPSPSAPGSPSSTDSSRSKPRPDRHHRRRLSSLLSTPSTPSTPALASLIATTANLSGAAAPLPSTVAPNPKRAGYHLARYYATDDGDEDADLDGEVGEGELDVERETKRVRERRRGFVGSPMPSRVALALVESGTTTTGSEESEGEEKIEDEVQRLEYLSPSSSRTTTTTERQLKRANWPGALALPRIDHSYFSWPSHNHNRGSTSSDAEKEQEKEVEKEKERERKKRRKAAKRRKESEIFITLHVAELLQRQEFLLKLARALMMFGAPTHRLEPLIQATARVLDMSVSCVYLPSLMLLSFNDDTTRTSETKFLKQASALDLGRLQDVHALYDGVIHDRLSVSTASASLDHIMRRAPLYSALPAILIGGLCALFITPISFSGSPLDALLAFPLGALLVLIQQLAARNELFTHVFEIAVALLISFLASALAGTGKVCYAAVASGSVVLILPGYIVLMGAMELASRNIVAGSVRMMYSLIYSLFLGFGLAIGAEIFKQITGLDVLGSDNSTLTCAMHDPAGPWWQRPPSAWWAFLCVPGFSLALSLRNQCPIKRKEFVVMILIACTGWTVNHFASQRFINRSDVTSALGALAVGFLGNIYGHFFQGTAFIVMVTGVLFQVPSSINGLLSFASASSSGSSDSYAAGFSIAEQLIQVSIGLTVGLFVSAVITHPFQSRKRGAGLFSF